MKTASVCSRLSDWTNSWSSVLKSTQHFSVLDVQSLHPSKGICHRLKDSPDSPAVHTSNAHYSWTISSVHSQSTWRTSLFQNTLCFTPAAFILRQNFIGRTLPSSGNTVINWKSPNFTSHQHFLLILNFIFTVILIRYLRNVSQRFC